MRNKFFVSIILCAIAFVSKAQFNTGTRLISGNITANIQNTSNNSEDLDGLKIKKTEQNNIIGAGIELGYGKIKKQNKANIFGLGYSKSQSTKTTNQTETLKTYKNIDESNINNYYLFAEKNNFIPVKPNWGFMSNLNARLQYSNSIISYSSQTKDLPNDFTTYGIGSVTSNYYIANLQINIGAYYVFHKNFILFTQLNLLGASLGYSNSNTKATNQNTNSETYIFNFSGVLTPTYKLGDFGIGLKYIIPAKN